MNRHSAKAFLIAVLCTLLSPLTWGISVGQIDNFNGGGPTDTAGWIVGAAGAPQPLAPPTIIANGGPNGAGDGFLQLTSTGAIGPGSRLTALNLAQWSGDYTSAGVLGITMDINNFGPNPLHLRLLLGDLNAAFSAFDNFAISTDAVVINPGSGWQRVSFGVANTSLTEIFGSTEAALAGVDVLRIFHNPNAAFSGPGNAIPAIEGLLGVDNISAVPLPPALFMFAAGLLGLWRQRRIE